MSSGLPMPGGRGNVPALEPGRWTRVVRRGERVVLADIASGDWLRVCSADYDALCHRHPRRRVTEAQATLACTLLRSGLMRPRAQGGNPVASLVTDSPETEAGPAVPERIYLNVTQRCNLKCRHCYFAQEQPGGRELTTAGWLRVLVLIREFARPEVVFSGGEPLLREDTVTLVAEAGRIGLEARLLTNGTLMTPEAARLLAANRVRVQVSLESGRRAVHEAIRGDGTFDGAIGAVAMLRDAGCQQIELVATLSRETAHDVIGVAELARRLGVSHHFSLFMPVGRGRCTCPDSRLGTGELCGFMARLIESGTSSSSVACGFPLEVRARTSCGAGARVLSLAPDGSVYPCPLMHGNEWLMGSSFELLRGGAARLVQMPGVDDAEPCRRCDVRYLCGGGCRARGLDPRSAKAMPATDGYCGFFRTLLGEAVWNWRDDLAPDANLRGLASRLRQIEAGDAG